MGQIGYLMRLFGLPKLIRMKRRHDRWLPTVRGYAMTRTIQAALDLGLLDALANGGAVTPEEYAREHDMNAHVLEAICEYLNWGESFNKKQESSEKEMLHFYTEVIKPLDTLYKEPLINDSYDFKKNSNFSKRGFEMIFEVQQKQFHSVHKLNEQFLFINRTLLGYYALFEKMGAKIETTNVKKLMKEYR